MQHAQSAFTLLPKMKAKNTSKYGSKMLIKLTPSQSAFDYIAVTEK